MGQHPLTQSNPVAPPLQRPLYPGCQQSVDCYVLPPIGDHLRPRLAFLSIFLWLLLDKGTNCDAA